MIELVQRIGNQLTNMKATVATAESCTGGGIGATITACPGASAYYLGGVITYTNAMKQHLIHVSEDSLARYTAVSEQVAREMADGVRQVCASTYSISVTGLAGPGGGTKEKPVGLVYIGIAGPTRTLVYEHHGTGTRDDIRQSTIIKALTLLEQVILEDRAV